MTSFNTKRLIRIALLTSLVIVLSYVSIPIPNVPITGQTLGIMLIGLILAPIDAGIAVIVYILLGAIGLPVFAGGKGGLSILVGPTGGYIWGFLPGAIMISLLKKDGLSLKRNLFATAIGGILIIHLMGFPWLGKTTGMGLSKALFLGTVPYLPGDLIKIALSSSIAIKIHHALKVNNSYL